MKVTIPIRLDDTYASSPLPGSEAIKPDFKNYLAGVEPLDTLPANWWNYFASTWMKNGAQTTDVLQVFYNELIAVLMAVGIQPSTASQQQLLDAINALIANTATPINEAIGSLGTRLETVEQVVPVQASSSNQLADKAFVNSSITNMAARFITATPEGDQIWNSLVDLQLGPWYYDGQKVKPTQNDYAIYIATNNETWRASYQSTHWVAAYKVNDTPFTAKQLEAINSNTTAELTQELEGLLLKVPDDASPTNLLADRDWTNASLEAKAFIDELRVVGIENLTAYLDERTTILEEKAVEMTGTALGLVRQNGSYTFTGTINVPTPTMP